MRVLYRYRSQSIPLVDLATCCESHSDPNPARIGMPVWVSGLPGCLSTGIIVSQLYQPPLNVLFSTWKHQACLEHGLEHGLEACLEVGILMRKNATIYRRVPTLAPAAGRPEQGRAGLRAHAGLLCVRCYTHCAVLVLPERVCTRDGGARPNVVAGISWTAWVDGVRRWRTCVG